MNDARMENNNQYDELLIRYLINEVNAEEKIFIENWIHTSDENLRYFESLKQAWQLTGARHTLDYVLDEMNVDERWDRFRQTVAEHEARMSQANVQEQSESENAKELRRKSVVYRLLLSIAVAASVILVIGWGISLFTHNKPNTRSIAAGKDKRTESTVSIVHHDVNTTGKEKTIQLSDSSLILLANKSEVIYREPFIDSRDITLTGKARFKVVKDGTRPFTVISGDISTTALGTEFTITAFKNSNKTIVRLYEGRVVIKPLRKGNRRMKNDVYLSPGQEFVYSSKTAASVRAFKTNHTAEEVINDGSIDNPSLPQNTRGSWYMFNNQSLGYVFDQLADMYDVQIEYNKQDVRNKYFVGRFNKSDSLDIILKYITTANKLTITKNNNHYTISK